MVEGLVAGELRALADDVLDLALQADVFVGRGVLLGPDVVQVVVLVLDLVDPPAGQLHQREEERLVVGRAEELAPPVLQVSGLELVQQLCPEGPQMAELHRDVAVKPALLLGFGVLLSEAGLGHLALPVPVKVGVYDSGLLGLVGPVEDLEDVAADELVVGVESDDDGVLAAVPQGREVDVLEGSGLPRVLDEGVERLVDGVEAEVVAVELSAAVGGGVVDDDHLVAAVVLREDRVQVALNAEVRIVIVTRNHDAHRQLLINA